MCGIVGCYSQDVSKKNFDNAIKKISHRGPDGFGIFEDDRVFLGHTRLAIQDISEAGNQPMIYGAEKVVLVFNG
jgi:asparagine synthase (glutamine-hydrolysing)